ncbi:MAG: hypothetical protein IJO32_01790 [Bacilli bacterium]|nr:hypothetical protein [Bacilli bacterium]
MDLNNKCIIAITGPSGAGKTTLGDILLTRQEVSMPRHCTTRSKRNDDRKDFYRYLKHEEYRKLLENNEFLISSGDGPIVKEEFGNFYGVLKKDCADAWLKSNVIILFVSYKDVNTLLSLKERGLDVDIINLTFDNIKNGVRNRLENDISRNHTEQDIANRINCALEYEEKYGKALKMYAKTIVYTDILDIEQTYQKVCKVLGFRKKSHE